MFGRTINTLLLFLLSLAIIFGVLFGTTKMLKTVFAFDDTTYLTFGSYAINYDPTGSTLSTYPRFAGWSDSDGVYIYSNNTTSGNGSIARLYVLFNLDHDWNDSTYVQVEYAKTGACSVYFTTYAEAGTQPATLTYSPNLTTATTTGFTQFNIHDSDTVGMGAYLTSYYGAQTCQLDVYSVIDNNGTQLLKTVNDYTSAGGGATTTEYVTEYLPTNVVVTSTLCTEETSTTTGQATTTCTNTLSTTSAYTYSLNTTDLENIQKTAFLFFAWIAVFLLIFWVIIKFIKTKYGHY